MALSGGALVPSREDERQCLGARRLAFLEGAAHGAGGGGRAGLLHTAHAHAHVLGLQNHDHALRVQLFDQRVGDLRGQTFLHLRSFRESIHQARELRQSADASIGCRNVRHMRHAEERREHME
mgnify:FL=1